MNQTKTQKGRSLMFYKVKLTILLPKKNRLNMQERKQKYRVDKKKDLQED